MTEYGRYSLKAYKAYAMTECTISMIRPCTNFSFFCNFVLVSVLLTYFDCVDLPSGKNDRPNCQGFKRNIYENKNGVDKSFNKVMEEFQSADIGCPFVVSLCLKKNQTWSEDTVSKKQQDRQRYSCLMCLWKFMSAIVLPIVWYNSDFLRFD